MSPLVYLPPAGLDKLVSFHPCPCNAYIPYPLVHPSNNRCSCRMWVSLLWSSLAKPSSRPMCTIPNFGMDYIFSPNILAGLVLGISPQDVPFVVWSFSARVVLQWCLRSCSCNSMTTSLISHMSSFSRAYTISYVIFNLQSRL